MNDPDELPVYEDASDTIERLEQQVRHAQTIYNCLRRQIDKDDRLIVQLRMEQTALLFRMKQLQNQAFANGLIIGLIVGTLVMMLIRFCSS